MTRKEWDDLNPWEAAWVIASAPAMMLAFLPVVVVGLLFALVAFLPRAVVKAFRK